MKDHYDDDDPFLQKAFMFRMEQCDNPKCGAHLIASDEDGNDICDITITTKAGPSFVAALQAALYKKAALKQG
jgi:hypothetical protein